MQFNSGSEALFLATTILGIEYEIWTSVQDGGCWSIEGGAYLPTFKVSYLQEEITLRGYQRHLVSSSGPGPLSRQEEEMKEIKENETR